jgi:structural maintenance of chromosome 3 (chondroitin sulfate proteoglycan 6)
LLRIDNAQSRLEALYAKQGRSNQFATRDERDAHLQSEIESTIILEGEQHTRVQQLADQVTAAERESADATSRKDAVQAELEGNKRQVLEKSQEKERIKAAVDEQTESRKSVSGMSTLHNWLKLMLDIQNTFTRRWEA